MEDNIVNIDAKINYVNLDETIKKAELLNRLLREANALVNELASAEIKLSVDIEN